MKSVKQQYINLKEGRMNQAQFMRNVRMSLPQYVTNVTSFDDTVKILKNKAILTEADIKEKTGIYTEEMENPSKTYSVYELAFGQPYNFYNEEENKFIWGEPTKATLYTKEEAEMKRKELLQPRIDTYQRTGKNYKEIHIGDLYKKNILEADIYGIAGDPEAEAERKAAGMDIKPEQTPEEKYGVDKRIDQSELNFLKKIYAKMPTEKIKQMIDDLEQKMSLNESYTTNTSGKELYSKFSEIDNLNGQEVLIGIDYEIEKNNDLTKKEAAKIAIKNLKKNPFYYTDSLMAGKEGYEPEYIGGKSANADARQMQLLDKNMSNVVDKKMGMQPVKGIEKDKASANKANKETNKPGTSIKIMSLVAKTVRGVKKMDATGEKMKKAALKENQNADVNALTKKIIDELENRDSYDSNDVLELIKMYQKKYNFSDAIAKEIDYNIFQYNADERYDDGSSMDDMLEYSTLPGGDNMTDVAGHQMDEAKASSLSIGDKFKIAADLGKFVMGEEVEVVSVEPFGNDIKLVLSNGKDKDDFYLDRNDEI